MRTKATNACQDDHICARLKARIYGAVHGVKSIWNTNFSHKIGVFHLLAQKKCSKNKLHWNAVDGLPFMAVWSSFFLIVVVTGHHWSCGMGMVWTVSCTVGRVWRRGDHLLWSPMVLTFSRWKNGFKWCILVSLSLGILTMQEHFVCTTASIYILIF